MLMRLLSWAVGQSISSNKESDTSFNMVIAPFTQRLTGSVINAHGALHWRMSYMCQSLDVSLIESSST
jgi:hypothetical protein